MVEENTTTVTERMTKEDLASLILNTVDVRFEGLEKTFGIRPLTWKEDDDIDQAVMSMSFPTAKTERDERSVRARERMRQVIQSAVVEPKLTKSDIQNMPVGLVIALSDAIDKISGFQPKK